MGALILPSRLAQQPQQAVPVDSGNPLVRGLVHSWGLNVLGALSAHDAAGNARGAFGAGTSGNPSGNSWGIGPSGFYLNFDDTGTGATASVALAVGNAAGSGSPGSNIWSFVARVRLPAYGFNNGSGTVGVLYGSYVNGIEFRVNSTGKLELLRQGALLMGTSTGTVPLNVDCDLGVSFNGSAIQFYINGVPAGSATSAQTFLLNMQYYLGYGPQATGNPERIPNGTRIYRADVWNRVVTASEFAAWSANPWQVYKAPAARLWVATLASTAASASLAWAEADDAVVLAGVVTDTAAAAWNEANDGHALAGVVTDRAAAAWTEADDAQALAGTVADRAALAWTESDDVVSIAGTVQTATPTNVSAALAWVEQDDGFAAFLSVATGGAPGYDVKKRRYVVRKGGQLFSFSDPEDAKSFLHADDEPAPAKQYPAKKAQVQPKVEPAPKPAPVPEQRVDLAELQALAERQHAEAEYNRLLAQKRYDTLLTLLERLREDEEDDWLLMAAE